MKKFCNKITKQQWRVTMPNINANIFRKSPSKEEKRMSSSGSYDLQAAEQNYAITDNMPGCTINSDSSDSGGEENFHDAKMILNKVDADVKTEEIYEDVDKKVGEEENLDKRDVPKICFSFFEGGKSDDVIDVKRHKTELRIDLKVPEEEDNLSSPNDSSYANEVFSTPKSNVTTEEYSIPKRNQTVSIHARMLEFAEQNIDKNQYDECRDEVDTSQPKLLHFELKKFDFDEIEDLASRDVGLYLTHSVDEVCSTMKSGSDPNISLRSMGNSDDGLYKVPRLFAKNRLSQSLNDFNPDLMQPLTKDISIEHISCSQVLNKTDEEEKVKSSQTSISMDYCKTRSKLPVKIKRATLLKKPKNKAIDTWANIKIKVRNFKETSQIGDKEKIASNLEEMYKSSKSKCKKVLRQTGMILMNKKEQDESSCSQIIKNDAFFAHLKEDSLQKELKNCDISDPIPLGSCDKVKFTTPTTNESDRKEEFDFNTIRTAFRRSRCASEGQNGFEDLRRYVKQGGDFCKELSVILQERSEVEFQYAKSLLKLSNKLTKACRENVGGLNEAWKSVAIELEQRAEYHRILGAAILEDAAKPLKVQTENQHRTRKQSENAVDKAAKNLVDWRTAEAKSKKHSHACARENEKLQDAMLENNRMSRSASLIQLAHIHKQNSDKENAKLEGKKRKAEDAVKKADIEYYTLCVRAERARLEWESAVSRGANTFQTLEEDRLKNLKAILLSYLNHSTDLGPKLIEASERLKTPFDSADPTHDLNAFVNLRHSTQQISEQLLPDFYCEHITLAMNRERRKQALVKLGHLIKQDIERERKSKNGLENLSRAIKQTPNFGGEESNQSVIEKLYHMKSMLTYLEGARYKIYSALGELDNRPRTGHPLAPHITITRDKSGHQQSVLKVPQWLKEQWGEQESHPVSEKSDCSEKSDQSEKSETNEQDLNDPDWTDRGTADGNSNQPDSDFDEFSSQTSSDAERVEENPVHPIARCKALYAYTPNLSDELALNPGDILSVYRQQDDGWWLGECNGSVGIFPATYVETLSSSNFVKC